MAHHAMHTQAQFTQIVFRLCSLCGFLTPEIFAQVREFWHDCETKTGISNGAREENVVSTGDVQLWAVLF